MHHNVDTARNILKENPQNDSQCKEGHLSVTALPAVAAAPQIRWDQPVPLSGDMPASPGPGWPVCVAPPEH